MTRGQKVVLIIGALLLLTLLILWLLSRKTHAAPGTNVTTRLVDPATGIEIGQPGVSNRSIGPAIPPAGAPDPNRPGQLYYSYSCPAGYKPVIEPNGGGVFCVLETN